MSLIDSVGPIAPFKIEDIPKNGEDRGLRYNKGKIRYYLFEPFATEQLALVFTKGAEKYEDRNWELGMKWSKMEASLMRHFEAYKQGKDFDIDPNCEGCKDGNCKNHTGLYHMAQVAMGILSYYRLFPQGDELAKAEIEKYVAIRLEILTTIDSIPCVLSDYPTFKTASKIAAQAQQDIIDVLRENFPYVQVQNLITHHQNLKEAILDCKPISKMKNYEYRKH